MLTRNRRMLQQRGKYPCYQIIVAKCYGLFKISYKLAYQLPRLKIISTSK